MVVADTTTLPLAAARLLRLPLAPNTSSLLAPPWRLIVSVLPLQLPVATPSARACRSRSASTALASITTALPPWICVFVEVVSSPVSVGVSFTPVTVKLPVTSVASVFSPPVPVLPPSLSVTVTLRVP